MLIVNIVANLKLIKIKKTRRNFRVALRQSFRDFCVKIPDYSCFGSGLTSTLSYRQHPGRLL